MIEGDFKKTFHCKYTCILINCSYCYSIWIL